MSNRKTNEIHRIHVYQFIRRLREASNTLLNFNNHSSTPSSSSRSSRASSSSRSPEPCTPDPEELSNDETSNENQTELVHNIALPPETMPVNIEVAPAASTAAIETTTSDVSAILGADPTITIEYGPNINKDLATRFTYIATSGLDNDTRKELLNKHLVPENCKNIDAPQLNPEIKGIFTEQVIKRDKDIEARQKQIASGITALGKIISTQLVAPDKNSELIKDLMEVGRIFCDLQHYESESRRKFALYSVKRELKDQLSTTKIDKYLFGNNPSDTLKVAIALSKSRFDLQFKTLKKYQAASHVASTTGRNINWKTKAALHRQPARYRQIRQTPAVQRNANSSRTYTQRASERKRTRRS